MAKLEGLFPVFTMAFIFQRPQPGDSFRYENLTLTVLAMDGRRVERVLVVKDEI